MGVYEAIFGPPSSSSKEVYHVTSDILGEEISGESPNHMISHMKIQGV